MSAEMVRPRRLRRGDGVAVLSPSWGGPGLFPHIFDAGLATLRDTLGFRVIEYPTTREADASLHADPRRRAADLHRAFADPDVHAVWASIGGDDSVRLLPFLDPSVFVANPKALLGFSDTTTLLTFANQAGLVTFHGPSVMAGLAQLRSLPPAFEAHLRSFLFEPTEAFRYAPYSHHCEGYPTWKDPANAGLVNELVAHTAPRVLQGAGKVVGRLFGGCLDVMEMIKGTLFWPKPAFWDGRLVFFETSEDAPPPRLIRRWLRNYGVQGVFDRAAGILFGRPRGYDATARHELERAIVDVIAKEFGRPDLPVVIDLDFGHTDPQWILPLGVRAEMDCSNVSLTLLESPFG